MSAIGESGHEPLSAASSLQVQGTSFGFHAINGTSAQGERAHFSLAAPARHGNAGQLEATARARATKGGNIEVADTVR